MSRLSAGRRVLWDRVILSAKVTLPLIAVVLFGVAAAAPVQGAASPRGVPGSKAEPAGSCQRLLRVTGGYAVGGEPGTFTRIVDPQTGDWKLATATGPAREQRGYDGTRWDRHDGILVTVDMPGELADARAEAFLFRGGWREPANRLLEHVAKGAKTDVLPPNHTKVRPPGANPIDLWFADDGRELIRSVKHTDWGPATTTGYRRRWHGDVVPRLREGASADSGQSAVEPDQVGGNVRLPDTRFATFALGGATFHDVSGRVSQERTGALASKSIAGKIGSALLSRFSEIVIDFDAKTVTFVPDSNLHSWPSGMGRELTQRRSNSPGRSDHASTNQRSCCA